MHSYICNNVEIKKDFSAVINIFFDFDNLIESGILFQM